MEFDADLGKSLFELSDHSCQKTLEVRRIACDRQDTPAARPQVRRGLAQAVCRAKHLFHALQEDRAGPGESHSPPFAHEELYSDFPLEHLDLLPQCRLRDPKVRGRGMVRARTSDLSKVA
jgi:hypothetical protein